MLHLDKIVSLINVGKMPIYLLNYSIVAGIFKRGRNGELEQDGKNGPNKYGQWRGTHDRWEAPSKESRSYQAIILNF